MNELAITVIGHDRPGIIADVAEILAGLGVNLTDSTMTRLRAHFAMTLICSGTAQVDEVEAALAPLTEDGTLVTTVRRVDQEVDHQPSGGHYVLSVHGADRLGIVATVARAVAEFGGNITDLTTRLAGSLYVLVAEVDFPVGTDVDMVLGRLAGVARTIGVDVTLRPAETDLL